MVVSRKLSNIQVLTLLESSPNRIFLFFKKEALYLYREHFECKLSSIKLVSSQLDSNNSKELNVLIQKEIQTLVQIHEGQKNITYELGCCISVPHSGSSYLLLIVTSKITLTCAYAGKSHEGMYLFLLYIALLGRTKSCIYR